MCYSILVNKANIHMCDYWSGAVSKIINMSISILNVVSGASLFPEGGWRFKWRDRTFWCGRGERNHTTSGWGLIKNQLGNNDQKQHYITINEIILGYFLVICTIFLRLTKSLYFHNHSINIYTIFVSLCIIPGPISNKYVNSSS